MARRSVSEARLVGRPVGSVAATTRSDAGDGEQSEGTGTGHHGDAPDHLMGVDGEAALGGELDESDALGGGAVPGGPESVEAEVEEGVALEVDDLG